MESPSDGQPFADPIAQAVVSSSCCWQDLGDRAWSLGPLREPTRGDLVLAEVTEPGFGFGDSLLEVQGEGGTVDVRPLKAGTVFVGALGDREAEDEWIALLPNRFESATPTLDLAAGCGLISSVQENYLAEVPTRVRILGAIHADGAPVTTKARRIVRPEPDPRSKVLLFVADKMNAGKSTAALACARALAAKGATVAVGKVTGTTHRRSICRMLEAGARVGQSFTDFGYASTKNVPVRELEHLFDSMLSGLSAEVQDGYVLLELADGFEQAETKAILALLIRYPVDHVVLCLSGSGDSREGPARSVELLDAFSRAHGAPSLLSGCLAAKPLHVDALQKEPAAAAIPLFDAATADPHELGLLLKSLSHD